MKENKRIILGYFIRTLQLTRAGEEISTILLNDTEETARIYYRNGYTKDVNIACDSGVAMLRDILAAIN